MLRKKLAGFGASIGAVMATTKVRTKEFLRKERGSLDQMVWLIGAAVVVVLVVVVFMTLAPSTAQNLWNSFISYARGKLGI